MRTILLLVFFICVFYFVWRFSSTGFCQEPETSIRKIQKLFINKGQEKYGLSSFGYGGGINEKIEAIEVYFSYTGKLSVKESRFLIVDLTKEFLKILEVKEEFHKYLHERPYWPKMLRIGIDFRNEETSKNEGFCSVTNYEGTLVYTVFDPDDPKKLRTQTIVRESFEEAQRILVEQGPKSLPFPTKN